MSIQSKAEIVLGAYKDKKKLEGQIEYISKLDNDVFAISAIDINGFRISLSQLGMERVVSLIKQDLESRLSDASRFLSACQVLTPYDEDQD